MLSEYQSLQSSTVEWVSLCRKNGLWDTADLYRPLCFLDCDLGWDNKSSTLDGPFDIGPRVGVGGREAESSNYCLFLGFTKHRLIALGSLSCLPGERSHGIRTDTLSKDESRAQVQMGLSLCYLPGACVW